MQGKSMEAERRGCRTLIYCSDQCISLLGSKRFSMGRSDQKMILDDFLLKNESQRMLLKIDLFNLNLMQFEWTETDSG